MTDKRSVPVIRFKGFDNAWGQWKLGNLFSSTKTRRVGIMAMEHLIYRESR